MADSDGRWTYEDGYTLITMISGDYHHAQRGDFERIARTFDESVDRVIRFIDCFGARLRVRTDRIESIEEHTPDTLDEIARVNAHAEDRAKSGKPSWLDS